MGVCELNRGAERDHFVGIHALVRFLAEDLLDDLLDLRDAGRTAHQHDFIDLLGLELRIFQGLLTGRDRAVQNRLDQLLELLAQLRLDPAPERGRRGCPRGAGTP